MSLSARDKVQVNAALATIHAAEGNASAVTARARALAAQGVPMRVAFGQAIDERIAPNAALAKAVNGIMRLVSKSDNGTVAMYGQALDEYNRTGRDTRLQQLQPMMARDAAALAIRDGATPESLASGGLEAALGFAPSDTMTRAALGQAPSNAASPFAQAKQPAPAWAQPATAPRSFINGAQREGATASGGFQEDRRHAEAVARNEARTASQPA